ncbi:MAG: hypothetical protein SAJ12_13590 [Jaaginema sp. PMC 1079.18]|nr:hypothetical protein [Jaaginema sp. PMC 1080.18]MEC4852016.1 hypothetical protein [Jaaginema sp. PMC 1079.18]MEC4866108.1 hypothetical protein [Jaaginema sp. PMC 1078.18]
MSITALFHSLVFEGLVADAGPYWYWFARDNCRVIVVKPFELLSQEFQDAGFYPAYSELPYRREVGLLVVTQELQLFGWSMARPWFPKKR